MSKERLSLYTKIACVLIPIWFLIGIWWREHPQLFKRPGFASVASLIIGLYLLMVCVFHLIDAFRKWRDQDNGWKKKLLFLYCSVVVGTIAMIYLTAYIVNADLVDYAHSFFMFFFFFSFPFVIGIASIIIGFVGLKYQHGRSKAFLISSFLVGTFFSIIGLPAIAVFSFFIWGPESVMPPCYCPVNRRGRPRDLLLRPLYNLRKDRLRKKLCLEKGSI
jgi:hypothetical protein